MRLSQLARTAAGDDVETLLDPLKAIKDVISTDDDKDSDRKKSKERAKEIADLKKKIDSEEKEKAKEKPKSKPDKPKPSKTPKEKPTEDEAPKRESPNAYKKEHGMCPDGYHSDDSGKCRPASFRASTVSAQLRRDRYR